MPLPPNHPPASAESFFAAPDDISPRQLLENNPFHFGLQAKLGRLLREDAHVNLRPKTLRGASSLEEIQDFESQLGAALYELGDFSGSRGAHPFRPSWQSRPFDVFMTVSGMFNAENMPTPGTLSDLLAIHTGRFSDDSDTQNLLSYLAQRWPNQQAGLAMILRMGGTSATVQRGKLGKLIHEIHSRSLEMYLEMLNSAGGGYRLKAIPPRLNPALQAAITRCAENPRESRLLRIITDADDSKGDKIMVEAQPGGQIRLSTVKPDQLQGDLINALSIFVERPLTAA